MNYKKMMFDLFKKGQEIYEEYAAVDYRKEFEEFKADKILYEKRSIREFAMLGRYEFFFPLYDERYRHKNHDLTMTPPEDSDYFAYYFKDGELRYVSLMMKNDVPPDFLIKVMGNIQIVLYLSSDDPGKRIYAIRVREEGDGKIFYTKIYGWKSIDHEVEYTIDYQDGREDVFSMTTTSMHRDRYVYSEEEKWYVLKKSDCSYYQLTNATKWLRQYLAKELGKEIPEDPSENHIVTIDDWKRDITYPVED